MIRFIILFLSLFYVFTGIAQVGSFNQLNAKELTIGERFYLPVVDTTYTPKRNGAVVLRPADNIIYKYVAVMSGPNWTPIIGTGGGSSYTFTNGLTESAGTVKQGGSFIENTTIDGKSYDYTIDTINNYMFRRYRVSTNYPAYNVANRLYTTSDEWALTTGVNDQSAYLVQDHRGIRWGGYEGFGGTRYLDATSNYERSVIYHVGPRYRNRYQQLADDGTINMFSAIGTSSHTFLSADSLGVSIGHNTGNWQTTSLLPSLRVLADSVMFYKKAAYTANFGSLFTPRSLVDKNYVDSVVSASSSPAALNNVGTGFDLAQQGTDNVKRLQAGFGIKLDSTTTANTVRVSLDTTTQTLTDGATVTFDANAGVSAKVTITATRTLAFSNFNNGMFLSLLVIQDGTGGWDLNLPAGTEVINGGAGVVTLTTAAASEDILTFWKIGNKIYCNYGKNYN